MAASILAALLAQNQPTVDGNQALIVFGLQNDFVGPNPKVRLPMESGWFDHIKELVPKFREFAGDIIWVRSECDVDAVRNLDSDKVILDSSDTDTAVDKEPVEEKSPSKSKKKKKRNRMTQFLRDMKKRDADEAAQSNVGSDINDIYRNLGGGPPCVLPGSDGAAFSDDVQALIQPEDIVVVKHNYSAFKGTDLLVRLRMKIITELYLVGCMSNLSVFATAQEAASHGLILNVVEDCMGYRTLKRHEVAMKTMIEHMGAYETTSPAILAAFEGSLDEDGGVRIPPQQQDPRETDDLSAALSGLGLGSNTTEPDQSVTDLAEALASSSLNRRSLNSPQPKSASRPPTANPSNETQSPLSAKLLRSSKSTPDIRNRSNVRVRVRKRTEAEVPALPQLPEIPKGALHAKTLSREDEKTKMIQSILEAKEDKEKESTQRKKGEGTR
jgi:nicotinamidase-related amidase